MYKLQRSLDTLNQEYSIITEEKLKLKTVLKEERQNLLFQNAEFISDIWYEVSDKLKQLNEKEIKLELRIKKLRDEITEAAIEYKNIPNRAIFSQKVNSRKFYSEPMLHTLSFKSLSQKEVIARPQSEPLMIRERPVSALTKQLEAQALLNNQNGLDIFADENSDADSGYGSDYDGFPRAAPMTREEIEAQLSAQAADENAKKAVAEALIRVDAEAEKAETKKMIIERSRSGSVWRTSPESHIMFFSPTDPDDILFSGDIDSDEESIATESSEEFESINLDLVIPSKVNHYYFTNYIDSDEDTVEEAAHSNTPGSQVL